MGIDHERTRTALTVEESMALYEKIRKQSRYTEDGKSLNPVVRAWHSRGRRANTLLLSMAVGGAIGVVAFWIGADYSSNLGLLIIPSGIVAFVGLARILMVPPICPGCYEQVSPGRVASEKIGVSRSYGIETRVASTRPREPYGGVGPVTQETTYTASYPTLVEHFRVDYKCPNCGHGSTRLTRQTHRIG